MKQKRNVRRFTQTHKEQGDTKPAAGAVQTAVTRRGQGILEAGSTWVSQDALRTILKILAAAGA